MLGREIRESLRAIPTPFYLYDMELLRRTLAALIAASSKRDYEIHYALKANFEQRLLQAILEVGIGVDCVSGNEVRAAIEAGCPPSKVAFAGVGKSDREIEYAVDQGIFAFNAESLQELEVIDTIARRLGKTADVALRINPGIDPHTHPGVATGLSDSKFGISIQVLNEMPEFKNLRINGLHFHLGSQITDMKVYEQLCERANELASRFKTLEYVNLGGGLGIDYQEPEAHAIPDFEAFFAIFERGLRLPAGMKVHFELGRSIVGQCGELISSVLYIKPMADGRELAIIDASMTELIRPALYGAYHAIENLDDAGRETRSYMVAGPVCESSDTFHERIELPELRRGDRIAILSAGAYGSSMASRYNLHDLPRSVFSDDLTNFEA